MISNSEQSVIVAAVTTTPQAIGYLESILLFMQRYEKEVAELRKENEQLKAQLDRSKKSTEI